MFVVLLDKEREQICRYGFNATNSEAVCNYYQDETPMGQGIVEQFYTDFIDVDGVRYPSGVTQSLEGQEFGRIKLDAVTANGAIPEDAFAAPQ